MRSSLGPVDHGSRSRPTKRDVVFGPVIGLLTSRRTRCRSTAQCLLDVTARDQTVASRAGERLDVDAVLFGVEANGWCRTWSERR
jgi:hypothetical protein